jgi:hypothetical protein
MERSEVAEHWEANAETWTQHVRAGRDAATATAGFDPKQSFVAATRSAKMGGPTGEES